MLNPFITGDSHLGHDMLTEKGHRPSGWEDRYIMNLRRAFEPAEAGQVLIHLGDSHIGGRGRDMMKMLLSDLMHVRRILVRGNHDSESIQWYFRQGWDFVVDSFEWEMYGKRILFTHAPAAGDFNVNIHGHLHTGEHRSSKDEVGYILISQEFLDYRPIPLRNVLEIGKTPMYRDGRFVALNSQAVRI